MLSVGLIFIIFQGILPPAPFCFAFVPNGLHLWLSFEVPQGFNVPVALLTNG